MLWVVNCKVICSKDGRAVEKIKESIYGDEQTLISVHSPLLPTVPSCSAKALLTQVSWFISPNPWKGKRGYLLPFAKEEELLSKFFLYNISLRLQRN